MRGNFFHRVLCLEMYRRLSSSLATVASLPVEHTQFTDLITRFLSSNAVFPRIIRDSFIRTKYAGAWCDRNPDWEDPGALSKQLIVAVQRQDLVSCYRLLVAGASVRELLVCEFEPSYSTPHACLRCCVFHIPSLCLSFSLKFASICEHLLC